MTTPYDSPRYREAWTATSVSVATMVAHDVPHSVIICALLEVVAALADSAAWPQAVRAQIAEVAYHAADLLAAPVTTQEI